MPESHTADFMQVAAAAEKALAAHAGNQPMPDPEAARAQVSGATKAHDVGKPETYAALASLTAEISREVGTYRSLAEVPAQATTNVRNDMYLASDAVRIMGANPPGFSAEEAGTLKALRTAFDEGTRFIPTWVKVSVALALGLGTMVGWKRIVVTVGERLGRTRLTYAQGASAEIMAAATIGMADAYGLPVSATHVPSSGVAGAMAANGSGLQWGTIRSIALAWALTLPAATLIAGVLFILFRQVLLTPGLLIRVRLALPGP